MKLSRTWWARDAAVIFAFVVATAAIPAGFASAQETPSVALEQARSGEDGTSGAGATSGGFSTGNAKRDKNGNGGNATAGGAGEAAAAEDGNGNKGGGSGGGEEEATASEPLPENAELLDALGILDDVTTYDVDVLVGMDIPVELLPPPTEPEPTAPTDVNTGGQGGDGVNSTISTEPGEGAAPAGGSTTSAAEDGTGSTANGEKTRDRPRKNDDGTTDTATTTDGTTDSATTTDGATDTTTTTDGGTETDSATG